MIGSNKGERPRAALRRSETLYCPLLAGGELALKERERNKTLRSLEKRSLDTQEKAFLEELADFLSGR